MQKFKLILSFLVAVMVVTPAAAQAAEASPAAKTAEQLPEVAVVLDWLPNANHTGLFVAADKGLFEGISVRIIPSGEEGATDLVIAGSAQFGIYFQDYLAPKIARGAPIAAVAAIAQRNTSGIIANTDELGKIARYGSYNYPVELAMLEQIFAARGLAAPKVLPNDGYSAAASIAAGMFDAANAFYAYDGIAAQQKGYAQHFFYYAELDSRFNFYTPLFIANTGFLAEHPARAKAFVLGLCRGYKYAAAHPDEAAAVLEKYAKSPESEREYMREQQRYLSAAYLAADGSWGRIDAARWDGFYGFVNELIAAGKLGAVAALAPGAGHWAAANEWLAECN